MLFSNDDVARDINTHFEPVWQSVASVPIVRVEFGDHSQTRTFGGNTVTWACDSRGRVLDLAPQVYAPQAYRQRLAEFVDLATSVSDAADDAELSERLSRYHQTCLDQRRQVAIDEPEPEAARRMGNWNAILIDTRRNEADLRPRAHHKLAQTGLVTPEELKAWVYRELMHLDLDDPYLGLGDALFTDYPFAAEDAERPQRDSAAR